MDQPRQTERDARKDARRGRNRTDFVVRPPWSLRACWPLLVVPIAMAAVTYRNALNGQFVFDDVPTVVTNTSIERLTGFWEAAFGPKHSPISNRPLVCFTFALNYALGGREPFGYHAFNLAVHLVNVGLLWAVVRRTLITPNLGGAFDARRATWAATAVAAVWAVHPLAVDAVVYVTQRTTLMMSFFLLLMLYGALRSFAEPARRTLWMIVSVASSAFAMLCKEEAAAAPILVILFDRAYHFGSFKTAFRGERAIYYAMLASTWSFLITVVILGPKNPTVGYKSVPQVNAFEWLMTESPVLVHYVRLTLWPSPLRAAYDWEVIRNFSQAAPYGLMVLGMLGAWAAAAWFKPPWGFLGAWFFLLLAPTSSIMPIISEVVAERRMYLPMLSILIPVVLGIVRLGERLITSTADRPEPNEPAAPVGTATVLAVLPLFAVVAVESWATTRYAAVFDTERELWSDVFSKNDLEGDGFLTSSLLSGYAKVLLDEGRHQEAIPLLRKAIECEPPNNDAMVNLAAALVDLGPQYYAEALQRYDEALRADPNHPNALSNYAKLMLDLYQADAPQNQLGPDDERMKQAYGMLQKAIQINPRNANYYNNLGSVSYHLGRQQEALTAWNNALALDPANVNAASNRAIVLAQSGQLGEAIRQYQALLAAYPQNVAVLINLAEALRLSGDVASARQYAAQAAALEPSNPGVQQLLQRLAAGAVPQ